MISINKLLLTILIFPTLMDCSNAIAYQQIICPISITCSNHSCHDIPTNFESSKYPFAQDGTYYFYQSQAFPTTCYYRTNPLPNSPTILIKSNLYSPDVQAPNNTWYEEATGALWCITNNPLSCPFYKY